MTQLVMVLKFALWHCVIGASADFLCSQANANYFGPELIVEVIKSGAESVKDGTT